MPGPGKYGVIGLSGKYLNMEKDNNKALAVEDRIKAILRRLLLASLEFIAHVLLVSIILGGIYIIQMQLYYYYGSETFELLGLLRLDYLFQGADLSILVAILSRGTYCTYLASRGD